VNGTHENDPLVAVHNIVF